jgi:UDP-N-acetylglucosamine--N-acetylmuramyl-(pentapeptide) pyrophosphoryl-undecaprenol N-acetylglucosamine transferase
MRTIVLTGGGTAGHVLPHVALIPSLKASFDAIHYIGSTKASEREIIEREGIPFYPLECVKLRRSIAPKSLGKNLMIPFGFVRSLRQAGKHLDSIKPDIVFSKGGFVALPVVMAAARRKIPVIAHESDMTLGLANRLSVKSCVKICTTFKQTATKSGSEKFIYTGSPIRPKIYHGDPNTVTRRHQMPQKPNLLVIGGSSGAQTINHAVQGAAEILAKSFNIVHICGAGKAGTLPLLRAERSNPVVIEYAHDIENYLAWADVVVSRAGSNALCELMLLGKPTVFIPLATGRGDQIDNSNYVAKHNAAIVLLESNLTPETLITAIHDAYSSRETLSRNAKTVVRDGTEAIVKVIVGIKPLEEQP